MYLAVDVGGSKTELATFDKKGTITHKTKFPTPASYEEFLTILAKEVKQSTNSKFAAAAIAIPGRIDRKHGVGISFGNLDWQLVPVRDDLEKLLLCPVAVENDAKLAGLSEARLIKKDFKKVLYITISTGIGSALIINGKIDAAYADAEAGHILLEHQGKLQRWEDFASGRAIKAKFGMLAKDIPADNKEAWYQIGRNIALGLIDLIATLTPEVVVIGGGVGTHFDKFESRLNEMLKIYDNPMISLPEVRQAIHPEDAVIYGCYELIKDKHGSR